MAWCILTGRMNGGLRIMSEEYEGAIGKIDSLK